MPPNDSSGSDEKWEEDSENAAGWSDPDGESPEWWSPESLCNNGDEIDVTTNKFRSFFKDDPNEHITTRLWGALLYSRELRYNGPEELLMTDGAVHRAPDGYCVENACALRHVLERRNFETRCIAVMAQNDIENCLGGDVPDNIRDTHFRHYLVQVKAFIPSSFTREWVTCDVSLYQIYQSDGTTYECHPYVSPHLPEGYVWFSESVELGEEVLGDRDPAYCVGEVVESDYI